MPNLADSALDQGLGEATAAATQTFRAKTLLVYHDFAGAQAAVNFDPQPLPQQVAVAGKLPLKTIATLRNYPAQPPTLDQVRASLGSTFAAIDCANSANAGNLS